jgi:transcriptional regulator GlxA family with amidase domain
VLYVDEGSIITGAGSAASLDASLHLMRRWYGARVAATPLRHHFAAHRGTTPQQYRRTFCGVSA